ADRLGADGLSHHRGSCRQRRLLRRAAGHCAVRRFSVAHRRHDGRDEASRQPCPGGLRAVGIRRARGQESARHGGGRTRRGQRAVDDRRHRRRHEAGDRRPERAAAPESSPPRRPYGRRLLLRGHGRPRPPLEPLAVGRHGGGDLPGRGLCAGERSGGILHPCSHPGRRLSLLSLGRRRPRRGAVAHGRHDGGDRDGEGHRARGRAGPPAIPHRRGRPAVLHGHRRRARPGAVDERRHGRGDEDGAGRPARFGLLVAPGSGGGGRQPLLYRGRRRARPRAVGAPPGAIAVSLIPRLGQLAFLLSLCIPSPALSVAAAAPAHLVADLNPGTAAWDPNDSSYFHAFTSLGDRTLFLGFLAGDVQCGLWATDGTAAGTARLADLCAESLSVDNFFRVQILGASGSIAFLSDSVSGLWRTDGTAAGTFRLGATVSMFGGTPFVGPGGILYFSGCDAAGDCEPWRSDGTVAGTRLLRAVLAGARPDTSPVLLFAAYGNRVVFSGIGPDGPALWITDGTA